jgi:hypothetical protein
MIDNVNHPSHYTQGGIECIDALKAATIGKTGIEAVCVANVIKYLWRYEEKNGLEDVKKAQWYIKRLIQELEYKKENNTFYDTDDVVGDCLDCANFNMNADSEPCCNCKNTAVPGTPEYTSRPLLFKWPD